MVLELSEMSVNGIVLSGWQEDSQGTNKPCHNQANHGKRWNKLNYNYAFLFNHESHQNAYISTVILSNFKLCIFHSSRLSIYFLNWLSDDEDVLPTSSVGRKYAVVGVDGLPGHHGQLGLDRRSRRQTRWWKTVCFLEQKYLANYLIQTYLVY